MLIGIAGFLLSGCVADLVRANASAAALSQRHAMARLAQGATLVLTLLVGADQIGEVGLALLIQAPAAATLATLM